MNLHKLQQSRERPVSGDVFTMFLPAKGWLFGRVVATDARINLMEEEYLVLYVYRHVSAECRVPEDLPPELLIPPLLTDSTPWRMGYFQTVAHVPLRREHLLPIHCFHDRVFGRYFNERNRQLKGRVEPCGIYALITERGLDDAISEALGVPLAVNDAHAVSAAPPIDLSRLPPGSEDEECSVVLYLPASQGSPAEIDVMEVEDALRNAIEQTGLGEWVGHGSDLETGTFDTQYVGRDCRALLSAVQQALEPLRGRLPQAWYVTLRIGDDQEARRVTIF